MEVLKTEIKELHKQAKENIAEDVETFNSIYNQIQNKSADLYSLKRREYNVRRCLPENGYIISNNL